MQYPSTVHVLRIYVYRHKPFVFIYHRLSNAFQCYQGRCISIYSLEKPKEGRNITLKYKIYVNLNVRRVWV